jgi:hypothetical protein
MVIIIALRLSPVVLARRASEPRKSLDASPAWYAISTRGASRDDDEQAIRRIPEDRRPPVAGALISLDWFVHAQPESPFR